MELKAEGGSEKWIERLRMLERVRGRLISQRQAAVVWGLSDRQVRRLERRYECEGAAGLVSRRRGRPSNRRMPESIRTAILARIRERYADFGPTLAVEYLRSDGFGVSREALRGRASWCKSKAVCTAGSKGRCRAVA